MSSNSKTCGATEHGYGEWLEDKIRKSRARGDALPHDEAMREVESAVADFVERRRSA